MDVALGDQRGIVHHGIQPAKAGEGKIDQTLRTALVGDILDVENRVIRPQIRSHRRSQTGFQSVDDNPRAFADATLGDGLADASGTAGDEDDFLGETHDGMEIKTAASNRRDGGRSTIMRGHGAASFAHFQQLWPGDSLRHAPCGNSPDCLQILVVLVTQIPR